MQKCMNYFGFNQDQVNNALLTAVINDAEYRFLPLPEGSIICEPPVPYIKISETSRIPLPENYLDADTLRYVRQFPGRIAVGLTRRNDSYYALVTVGKSEEKRQNDMYQNVFTDYLDFKHIKTKKELGMLLLDIAYFSLHMKELGALQDNFHGYHFYNAENYSTKSTASSALIALK